MTIADLIKHRLSVQQLSQTAFTAPVELVSHFGAMQAQDYAMAKWAVGIRTGANNLAVEQSLNNGEIVRTHILRPTWHLVAAADVRWMLTVSAPRIKAICASMNRILELDAKTLTRSNTIIEKSLAGHKHLTREELMQELNKRKIATNDLRSIHIMMNAEQDGIVCNGPMRGKQLTYALIEERIPPAMAITRAEAMAKLAKKYFTSHGPATLHDFSWWSGLSLTEAKSAFEPVRTEFASEQIDGKTYWFNENEELAKGKLKGTYFLPAYDEFLVSYKDRTASLHPSSTREIITSNGIFKPVVLVDGKVAGLWKRTIKKEHVDIEIQYLDAGTKIPQRALHTAANRYAGFMGVKAVIPDNP